MNLQTKINEERGQVEVLPSAVEERDAPEQFDGGVVMLAYATVIVCCACFGTLLGFLMAIFGGH